MSLHLTIYEMNKKVIATFHNTNSQLHENYELCIAIWSCFILRIAIEKSFVNCEIKIHNDIFSFFIPWLKQTVNLVELRKKGPN